MVAKWTYTKVEDGGGGFSKDFYSMIGLEDLAENDWCKIGKLTAIKLIVKVILA